MFVHYYVDSEYLDKPGMQNLYFDSMLFSPWAAFGPWLSLRSFLGLYWMHWITGVTRRVAVWSVPLGLSSFLSNVTSFIVLVTHPIIFTFWTSGSIAFGSRGCLVGLFFTKYTILSDTARSVIIQLLSLKATSFFLSFLNFFLFQEVLG